MFEPANKRSTYLVFNLGKLFRRSSLRRGITVSCIVEVPEFKMTEEREKEKRDQVEQIVLTFIADDSPLQINLPDEMRKDILEGVR